MGDSAAFTHEDIDQLALEGLLILAGHVPGSKLSIAGTLKDIEAKGGARYVQHAVDAYISMSLRARYNAASAEKRGAGEGTIPWDAEVGEDGETAALGDLLTAQSPMEANPDSLSDAPRRFRLLYLTTVEGYKRQEILEREGMTKYAFEVRHSAELADFVRWARANRRVEPGAEPKIKGTDWERKRVRDRAAKRRLAA